jgi:hypothetical protein
LIERKILINKEAQFGSISISMPLKQRCMLLFDILQSRRDLAPRRLNSVLQNLNS